MALLLLDDNVKVHDVDDEDMLANPDEVNNYKGMYQNDDDEQEQKYFEFGAHFPYDVLCRKLDEIRRVQLVSVKESPSKEGINKGIYILIKEQNFRKANGNSNNPQLLGDKIKPKNSNLQDKTDKASFISNNSSKLASITLGESNPGINVPPMPMENNFLISLNTNNKSRNNNINNNNDNVYKPGTGVGVQINNNYNLNLFNYVKEKDNLQPNIEAVHPMNKFTNTSTNKFKFNVKKEVKTKDSENELNSKGNNNQINNPTNKAFNLYTSYGNDNTNTNATGNGHLGGGHNNNLNNSNISITMKSNKNFPNKKPYEDTFTSNNVLFKKSSAIVLFDKKKTGTNSGALIGTLKGNSNTNSVSSSNAHNNSNLNKTGAATNVKINLVKPNISQILETKSTSTKPNTKININSLATTKLGRNNPNNLNPHNTSTNNNATLTRFKSGLNALNSNTNNTNASSHNYITKEIKKLNLTKLGNKSEAYRYITSSVDNRENSVTATSKNKNISLSPSKVVIDSTRFVKEVIQTDQIDATSIIKQNNLTQNFALNDIISSLNKNHETKSRNAARNNLTSTKSNLFNSDKAQSMQSGSYQKGLMLTGVNVNKSTNILPASNINNISKRLGTGITNINKTTANYKTSINTKTVNKWKETCSKNNPVVKKNVLTNVIKSQNISKKIIDSGTGGTGNTLNKNTLARDITPGHNSGSNNKAKIVASNYIKIDSSKIKLKNNSVTSNASNANNVNLHITNNTITNTLTTTVINNISNSTGTTGSLIKNYYFNKNPTKFSNVSYLNLKKNEYSIARNITIAPSDKNSVGVINTFSSASIEKNPRKNSLENSTKNNS